MAVISRRERRRRSLIGQWPPAQHSPANQRARGWLLVFCAPFARVTHPDLPLIMYSSGSGGLLERLATTKADVIALDGTGEP